MAAKSKEYRTWIAMKDRAFNERSKDFSKYGKLGMSLPLAADFGLFLGEVGFAPSKDHQIDRIDNRVGYFEGNLRWATRKEQQSNRSTAYIVKIDGMEFNGTYEAARYFNRSDVTIRRWCDGYFDKRRGTHIPPKKGCKRELKYAGC